MARVQSRFLSPTLALPLFLALGATACGEAMSPDTEPEAAVPSGLAEADLDAVVATRLHEAHLPGLAACIVRGGAVAFCKGYGLADIAARRPVTPDTPFLLASVSKVFTATALLQLWERGGFDLDDEVSQASGFPIRYPGMKGPITYRRLLSHVAGIADSEAMNKLYAYGKDPDLSLEQVIEGYFVPGGAYYDAGKNFLPGPPGTVHSYSNMGFALLGYLAQAHAGQDFAAFCTESIFEPLGMKDTSWHLADFPEDGPAVPYSWYGGAFESYEQYTFADYPDGGLRSSARSVATFLASQARGGELGGHRILASSTLSSMFDIAYPALDETQGLAWYHHKIGGDDWVGHQGTESGVYTEMFLRPNDGLGLVILTNGDVLDYAPVRAIESALITFGQQLSP
jgi:CubicO group peptidase (beta-lactamase class C family)